MPSSSDLGATKTASTKTKSNSINNNVIVQFNTFFNTSGQFGPLNIDFLTLPGLINVLVLCIQVDTDYTWILASMYMCRSPTDGF